MPLAPLHNSVIFKKLFRDPEILHVFLKDLIGIDLDIRPEYIETEKRFTPPVGPIDIIMDIVVEDPTHRILVEIQRERYDYHYDRFLHYHQVATVELATSHRHYKLDRTVYTVVWLTARSSDPLYQHSLITTSLCSVTEQGEDLRIYPHRLFFLNPFYRSDQTPGGLADWLQLVVESIVNPEQPVLNYEREVIRKATTLIQGEHLTPEERRIMFEETGFEQHLHLREEQGRQAEKREIARAMRQRGLDHATIADLTGLSEDEIAAL
jgi:predicted transposase/invertase (TIGR01784 family)